MQRKNISKLSKMGIYFKNKPGSRNLTTPEAFERLAPGADGSIYGLSPERLLQPSKDPPQKQNKGPLSGGRGNPSRTGFANGSSIREACGRNDKTGPCFDLNIPPNGYGWWYMDGLSDDGTKAVSVIAFIGSVFSPWYSWSGRKILMTFVQ